MIVLKITREAQRDGYYDSDKVPQKMDAAMAHCADNPKLSVTFRHFRIDSVAVTDSTTVYCLEWHRRQVGGFGTSINIRPIETDIVLDFYMDDSPKTDEFGKDCTQEELTALTLADRKIEYLFDARQIYRTKLPLYTVTFNVMRVTQDFSFTYENYRMGAGIETVDFSKTAVHHMGVFYTFES